MAWYDNLELTEDFLHKAHKFCELVLDANKSTNLVSKNDSQKLFTRHVLDSLVFTTLNPKNSSQWADIGSGAGFPVVPLCLYLPQIKFHAIENRKKRCEFLNFVKQKLNLQNLEIIQGKAENSGLKDMDFVSCRAVASLEEDFERAKRMLKSGGYFFTVKSKRIIDELRAKNDKLLKNAKILSYHLPEEEMEYAFFAKKIQKS
jgi:16S rRNA (guanine527-N7)-methyltransferase